MTSALAVAGPSRRTIPCGARARLWHVSSTIKSSRHYRVSVPVAQDAQAKKDVSADISVESSDRLYRTTPSIDPPSRRSQPSRDSAAPQLDHRAWQLPPAWRSQLDPDAPWRKSLLEQRRRWMEQAGQQLTAAGLKLNEVTGYKEVERLKALVEEKETRLKWLREDAKTAKEEYERAVTTRSTSQSDVNSLLERKHIWSDEDVSRFTQLVRSDHTSNQAVSTTSLTLRETELAVDKAFSDLMQAILQRYHEEQVWSDKIRNVSTYANLVGLLINLVVFVGAIAFVEPWKRRRLVERLEEKIAGMMDQVEGSINGLGEKVGADLASIRTEAQTRTGISPPSTAPSQPAVAPSLEGTGAIGAGPAIDSTTPAELRSPILAKSFDKVAHLLDHVAPPSHDRDVLLSACVGATAGIALSVIGAWVGR